MHTCRHGATTSWLELAPGQDAYWTLTSVDFFCLNLRQPRQPKVNTNNYSCELHILLLLQYFFPETTSTSTVAIDYAIAPSDR